MIFYKKINLGNDFHQNYVAFPQGVLFLRSIFKILVKAVNRRLSTVNRKQNEFY